MDGGDVHEKSGDEDNKNLLFQLHNGAMLLKSL